MNRAAAEARVEAQATDPSYRLVVSGAVANPLSLTLDELDAMATHRAELPIACVEGWSAAASWRGVPVRDMLQRAGVDISRDVSVEVRPSSRTASTRSRC